MTRPGDHAIFAFRISSLLLIIAVVAVCLAGWQAQPYLGIALAAAALPALGYTSVLALKGAAASRPMLVLEKVRIFCAALVAVVVIAFASLVAFCMTCYPVGALAFSAGAAPGGIVIALVIGGMAGTAVATVMTYFLLRLARKRRGAQTVGEP